ncbi:hypothetical protein HY251_03970, partial [bacterium]|nr:hypothetical protein [bacterium]
LAGSGCSIDRMAANNMVPILRRTDVEFERMRTPRAAREAGPGLLATLDGVVATSPRNPELLEVAAQMNCTFAFAFLEEDEPAWATELYEKAQGYARRALAVRDEALAKAADAPLSEKPKLDAIEDDLVPALFWFAFAWGSRINLNRSDEKVLGGLEQVDRAMKAVLERDEGYFNGGPHLYFAMRYTSLGKAMGGNPQEGKKHFDRVDQLTQSRHLMAKVLRAKFYSSSLQVLPSSAKDDERAAALKAAWDDFFLTLKGVVEAKDDLWPEQRLANEIAKQRARKLLAHPDEANILTPPGVENPFKKKGDDD